MSRGIHRRGGGQRQERKGQGEDAHGDVRAAAVQIIISETSKRLPDFETTLNTWQFKVPSVGTLGPHNWTDAVGSERVACARRIYPGSTRTTERA